MTAAAPHSRRSYDATLRYLYALQYRGMKFGLRNIRALLQAAGNPHTRFPSVHIAGTNGKGSTSSFIASIAMEAGFRTGLYTSPHLVDFTERIRINGIPIPTDRLVEYTREIRSTIERVHATFFEATTCIAFTYFADEMADFAVIETGLGGRLDATNVLLPLCSVITNIDLEHTEYLGTTLTAIAREKGGIIKPRTPVVTGTGDPQVLRIFRRIAQRRHASLRKASAVMGMTEVRGRGASVSFRGSGVVLSRVKPGLRGEHQRRNARLAVAAVALLRQRIPFLAKRFTARAIRRGLERVMQNTGLRGRLDRSIPGVMLDVAHNPAGIRTLVKAIRAGSWRPSLVVFGVMKDKDHRPMLEELGRLGCPLVSVAPAIARALPAAKIVREARNLGIMARLGGTVAHGVSLARRLGARVLVTGSHYVVGEALSALEKKTT
jgi:dihydrofolate synthase/folylpolyglutamate synthase